ncbi:MAG: putative quinol monooxygenase [Paraglaciecola sp.]|uniref:putative quinol monooxygenase n=1 Tax=Paraglaciecola sp. TaxID=1920173 RepID=UPI003296BD46
MITVQNTFHLLSESKSEAIDLMKNMVLLCRKEQGCISYEYFEGITDSNQIILLQEWENAESLQGHYQTEHMNDFMSQLIHHLEKPIITRSYFTQKEDVSGATKKSSEKPNPQQTIH